MFFAKIFRRFFFSIDAVLFNFIGTLYDLLIAISRTSILTQGDIATFAARIEVLLGIFMLFKVSFSLITYVVNPDDFSDKSKGFGKLIQSSVISLVLLVLVPYIFQMAFSLQTKVLEGNILARLILGEDSEQSGVEDNFMTEAGEKMAYYVMLPFFKPNYSINLGEGSDLSECINIYQKDDGDKNVFSEECKNALTSVNNKQSNGMDDTDIENYANGITEQSLGLTFRMNAAISTVGSDSDEQFVIDYKSPISTVVAVIVCLLLVSFCIDIGIRSIKLAFLQLIYPIPVISFMDPKSGKDGMFSKWYKMCLSTFLSLFVRLLALYFGLYIISKVGSFGVYDVVNGSQITNGWIMIFIIIGVLMFIKQLPKILENMGIKLEGDGKFNLNPLKRLEEGAVGGKILKKPNEMLGKLGKGALFAAPHALQTGGKKFIGGIDAARNGKGFKQGWNRTHGKLYNAYHKKIDEWAPDSAEARKAERQGHENLHQMSEKMRRGMKAFAGAKGSDKNLKFSTQYRQSYDAVNAAKGEMYKAQANKQAELNRIEQAQQANIESARKAYESKSISEDEMNRQISVAQQTAQQQIANVNKVTGTAEKRYEVAKAKHDEMKKIYTKDAALEDAYDYYDKTASNVDKFVLLTDKDNKLNANDFVKKYSKKEFDEISKRTGNSIYSESEKATIGNLYGKK